MVKGNTVVFNFKGTPNYVQWQNMIWNMPMISPVQAQDDHDGAASSPPTTRTTRSAPARTSWIRPGFDATTRVVWVKKAHWWAADQGVCAVAGAEVRHRPRQHEQHERLSAVLAGVEDLNNNYLPGVSKLVESGQGADVLPEGAVHAVGEHRLARAEHARRQPLNDPVFRKALAMSIDINKIVSDDYGNLVLPASPTGLLPTWSKYDQQAASSKQYGFTYNAASGEGAADGGGLQAGQLGHVREQGRLEDRPRDRRPAGLVRLGGRPRHDHRVRQGRGDPDHAKVKDFNTWQSDRNTGKFDLVVDNHYQLSDNPWTYWNGIFHLPVITTGTGQTFANFERYENATAWALVQKLDKTPPSNTAAIKSINNQLQTILMKDLPAIPLWYNGIWAQMTHEVLDELAVLRTAAASTCR